MLPLRFAAAMFVVLFAAGAASGAVARAKKPPWTQR